jgi:hypothetical protein
MRRRNAKVKANVKTLILERDRLLKEMEAIKNQITGLERAISLIEGDDESAVAAKRSRRGTAKSLLLDMLREVGTTGLNASSASEMASRRGAVLARGTAASNLSRMKADKLVVYDGERYRLPEFTRPTVIQGGAKGS